MDRDTYRINRRTLIAGAGATGLLALFPALFPTAAHAQGFGLSSILGKATDSALDKLAKPGTFYDDKDIRIGLPILGKSGGGLLGGLLNAGNRLGLLNGLTRNINDAAGVAAGEAKPIFRDAIDNLSFSDAPEIVRESDGGTQYLRQSSNHTAFQA